MISVALLLLLGLGLALSECKPWQSSVTRERAVKYSDDWWPM